MDPVPADDELTPVVPDDSELTPIAADPLSQAELTPVDRPATTEEVWRRSAVDPRWAAKVADENAQLTQALKSTTEPDKKAAVIKLAGELQIPPEVVEKRFDDFKTTWEASKFNAEEWSKANPALRKLALEHPELGDVVVRDVALTPLNRLFNYVSDAIGDDFADNLAVLQGPTIFSDKPVAQILAEREKARAERTAANTEERAARDAPKPTLFLSNPSSQWISGAHPELVPVLRFKETWDQLQVSQMQFELMTARHMPGGSADTYELEKRIVDAQQASASKDYNEQGALEQNLTVAAQAFASQAQVLKDAGAFAGVGGVAGFLVGLAATKSPAGAARGALKGASLLGKAGVFYGSVKLEAGGAYEEFRRVKTDAGENLTEDEAAGAAITYGLLAATVEVASTAQLLKALGPIGAALRKGTGKAAMAELLHDAGFRDIVRKVGKEWFKEALAEGGEEFVQDAMQQVTGYIARSSHDQQLQKGTPVDVQQSLTAGWGGLVGGGAMGAGASSVHAATQLFGRGRDEAAGRQAAALAGIQDSPTVKAAPQVVADLIERESAAGGSPVTHLHIDAQAFAQHFQDAGGDQGVVHAGGHEDAATAAELLFGPGFGQKLQEAISTGGKLAIPVGTYLEHFGGTDLAKKLAADTTAQPWSLTPRQLAENGPKIEEQAQALAEAEARTATAGTETSRRLDDLEAQLVAVGKHTPDEASKLVTGFRRFLSTAASRFNLSEDKLFSQFRASAGLGDVYGHSASKLLSERAKNPSPQQRASDLYLDPLTGLRNFAGWEASQHPAGQQVLLITSPDIKAVNDDPQGGHDTSNAVLRAMSQAIAAADPTAARKGTGFLFHGDEAKLQEVLDRVRATLPGGLTAIGAAGKDAKSAGVALRTLEDGLRESGALPERGKTALDLKTLPQVEQQLGQVELGPAAELPQDLVDKAGSLTPAQMFRAYLDEKMPGVLNATGWRLVPRRAFVASIDLKGLKAINDLFQDEGKTGDEVLKHFADAAKKMGGNGLDFAHLSGDEFAAAADSHAELQQFLDDLEVELKDVRVPATLKGKPYKVRIAFRSGIGEKSYGAADRVLNAAKAKEPARAGGDHGGGAAGDAGKGSVAAQGAQGPGNRVPGQADLEDRRARARRRGTGPQAFRDRQGTGSAGDGGAGSGEGAGAAESGTVPTSVAGDGRLKQPGDDETPRGYTQLVADGLNRVHQILLNPTSDVSTFLHESSHVFLELFVDLANHGSAPTSVRSDFAATLQWMGIDQVKRGADGWSFSEQNHEKWARTFEAYVREGKAPSAQLRGAFRRFTLWLRDIYRDVVPGSDLNPTIRGVFDRLLATDDEIDASRRAMGFDRSTEVFKNAGEAGMTEEQFQHLLEQREQAASHVERALMLRAAQDELRETEAWWKEAEGKFREQASKDYDQRPDVRASRYLRRGELVLDDGRVLGGHQVKLDKAAVEKLLGPAAAKKLLGRHLDENGENPDTVAGEFGFATAKELLAAIAAVPDKKLWVKATALQSMVEKYPSVMEDRQQLRELVSRGLHGDLTAEVLLKEWSALRARAKQGSVAPIEAVKEAARLMVEKRELSRLDVGQALRQERSSAEAAATAAAKGDWTGAAVAKQRQLLNHFMFSELNRAKEERDAFLEKAAALSKEASRERLGKASPVYRDGIDMLLEAFDLKAPTDLSVPRPSLGQVVAEMQGDGASVLFDEDKLSKLLARSRPAAPANPTAWKQLSVADMRELHTALKNISRAGSVRNSVIVGEKTAELEHVVEQLVADAARNLPPLPPLPSSASAATPLQKLGGAWNSFDGSMLRPELMVDWLAGGDLKSMWHRAITQPLQEAKHREADLLKQAIKPIVDAFEKVPAKVRARFTEKIDGETLFPGHQVASGQEIDPPNRRFQLLLMALNAGNQSNLDRLLLGRNITEPQLMAAINLLTKEELDWVQSIWDAAEGLWPLAAELEERDAGVAPKKLELRPLVTVHGTLKGGYLPAVYDRNVEQAGTKQVLGSIADLLDPGFTRAFTPHSHLKNRVEGFTGAIALEPGIISAHFAQVAHDLAFRQAVKSVGGLIMDERIQAALKNRLGPERAVQFLQWVKDIGQMRGSDYSIHEGVVLKGLRALRANTVIAALGYSLPNAIEDLTSNLLGAVPASELEAAHLAAAIATFTKSPLQTVADAQAKSGELRFRKDQIQRDLQRQVKSLTLSQAYGMKQFRWMKDHAFVFAEHVDEMTATPIWLGAYRQAIANNESEGDAVTFADAVVRKLLPSHSAVDQAALLRSKGFVGTSLVFFGFFNTFYQRQRDLAHQGIADVREGRHLEAGKKAGRLLAYATAVSVFGAFMRGQGPERDEGWQFWFLRKLLGGQLSMIPLAGDAFNTWERMALGKQAQPRPQALSGWLLSLGEAMMNLQNDDKEGLAKYEALLRFAGQTSGFPTTPLLRVAKFLYDVSEGTSDVADPMDAANAMVFGDRGQKTPLHWQ